MSNESRGFNLQEEMARHDADLCEAILCEGVPDRGYRTYQPRGFHLYSSKDGYKATILWGMDNENKPFVKVQ